MDVLARVQGLEDDGLATAEYATCVVAGTGFAAVLYEFLTSSKVREVLIHVIGSVLRWPF